MMSTPGRADLDAALKIAFPEAHVFIQETDREALVRRKICTTDDLTQLVGQPNATAVLTDLTKLARCLLTDGKQTNSCETFCNSMHCHPLSWVQAAGEGILRVRVSAAGGSLGPCLYSMRRAVQEPMAPLCDKPSWMDTPLSARRQDTANTVTGMQGWEGFSASAQALTDSLSGRATMDSEIFPSTSAIPFPDTEGLVVLACMNQLGAVNTIAARLPRPITSKIVYGGGTRSFTHASMLVREAAQATGQKAGHTQGEAARVSAVVKVTLSSDFQIARGDTWADILEDPEKLRTVEPALQKVASFPKPLVLYTICCSMY